MTSVKDFYALAAQAPIQHRRYALGAAYVLQERVAWGESITSARNRVMSLAPYASALTAAGLDDDYALIDTTGAAPETITAVVPPSTTKTVATYTPDATDPDGVTLNMFEGAGGGTAGVQLTQAEYDALAVKSPSTTYFIVG